MVPRRMHPAEVGLEDASSSWWAGETEDNDEPESAEPESDEPEPEPDEPEDIRRVVVRTSPFATPEDLARYTLRNAEYRRPREMYPTRLLLRRAGPIRGCGSDREDLRAARQLVQDIRAEAKDCIVQEQTRQPGVMVRAPAALVLEQAARRSDIAYSLSVHLRPGESARVTSRQSELSSMARRCIADVVDRATPDGGLARMEIPLTVFKQPPFRMGGHPLHEGLAREAATVGWTHYDRQEYAEALEYFRDAYWLFHLVDYRLLEGMALERLGRSRAAIEAYVAYMEGRPYAPEVPQLRRTVAQLRAEAGQVGPTADARGRR